MPRPACPVDEEEPEEEMHPNEKLKEEEEEEQEEAYKSEEEDEEEYDDDDDMDGRIPDFRVFSSASSSTSSSSGAAQRKKKKKRKNQQTQCEPRQEDAEGKDKQGPFLSPKETKRSYLKPAHLVFQRFKWDPQLRPLLERSSVGYIDRFLGLIEQPFTDFKTVDEDEFGVPFHRIRNFKIDEVTVWDREARVDLLTPGTWMKIIKNVPSLLPPESPKETDSTTLTTTQATGGPKRAVLFSCGSFCPVHNQHIHMLEVAKKHLEGKRGYNVVAAILSITSDSQLRKKLRRTAQEKGLSYENNKGDMRGFIKAKDRARIIECSTLEDKQWVVADLWAAENNAPAAQAQRHVQQKYNSGPVSDDVEVISVFGADALQKIRTLKNKKSSIIVVVNRKYDFEVEQLFAEKTKKDEDKNDCSSSSSQQSFIDLVYCEDENMLSMEASSTMIREAFLSGDVALQDRVCRELLHPAAHRYIVENNILPVCPLRQIDRPTLEVKDIHQLANEISPGLHIGKEIKWKGLNFMPSSIKKDMQQQTESTTAPERIGQGVGSDVFTAVYSGIPVAVKVFESMEGNTLPPRRTLRMVFNEIIALRQLSHNNIVRYIGAGLEAGKVFIVLELGSHGCLAYFLQNRFQPPASSAPIKSKKADRWKWGYGRRWRVPEPKLLKKMLLDIAKGMEYAHQLGIIHRDLSVDNVLVFNEEELKTDKEDDKNSSFAFKVADFGLCQHKLFPQVMHEEGEPEKAKEKQDEGEEGETAEEKHRHLVTLRGSLRLYAPEAVQDVNWYSFPADVFMYGMLLYEVLEGLQAYRGMSTSAAIQKKMKGERPSISPENKERYPPFVELMEKCWQQEPQNRPTFAGIVQQLEQMQC